MTAVVSSSAQPISARYVEGLTVLLVGPMPPPPGGMANQTRQLADLLRRDGCRVIVVQTNAPYRPAWIGNVRGVRALFRLFPYVWTLVRSTRAADVIHVMANSGWSWHLVAAPAVWIGAALRRPVVVNYRGGDADAFFARHFRWVRPTLARARLVAVPSGYLQAIFSKYGAPTTVVPNVVNLDSFHPAPTPPATPHIIVTRNLEAIYDIGTAIRAFAIVAARYPAARLTIAGSGPCREALEMLVDDLKLRERVAFIGRVDNSELPDLYRGASVLVNPSLVDNMPISLLEAMASSVPIVSTDIGGIPYLVKDGESAVLVPARAPEAMAKAIVDLLANPELSARIAANALAQVERYTWTRVRERWARAYEDAIRTRRR